MTLDDEGFNEEFEWIALNEVRSGLTSRKAQAALNHFSAQMEALSKEKPLLTSREVRALLISALRFGLDS